jgi:hypothetical protein
MYTFFYCDDQSLSQTKKKMMIRRLIETGNAEKKEANDKEI